MIIRRLILIALSVALLAAFAFSLHPSSFALAQDKPTEEPSKPPLQEEPTKASVPLEAKKTPIPGSEPTKTLTPFGVTKTPTLLSTWTATPIPTQTPEATSVPTDALPTIAQAVTPQGGAQVADKPAPTPVITVQVIGVVFDDTNGNDQRDPHEPGLPGVLVVVEDGNGQPQTLVTDSGGTYIVSAPPSAVVKVIPPAGWGATRLAALPAREAGDFPLRRRIEQAVPDSPTAPVNVTKAVYDFSTLALAVAALGATIFFALERLRRALIGQFSSWALTNIRLNRESLNVARQARVALDDPLHFLNQAALDATGENVHLIAISQVLVAPYPAIVVLADDQRRFIFSTVSPETIRRRENWQSAAALLGDNPNRVSAYPLDALNSSLFIADDLGALFAAETKTRFAGEQPPLPRVQRWFVYVVNPPTTHLAGRRSYLRGRSILRWALRR